MKTTANKKRLVVVHNALAPYRVDFFNTLSDKFNLHIVFINKYVSDQEFDQSSLFEELKCSYEFSEKKIRLNNRNIPLDICSLVLKFNPDIVLLSEYSPSSILVVLDYRIKQNALLLTLTDDNVSMCEKPKMLHNLSQKLLLKKLKGLIVLSDDVRKCYSEKKGISREKIYASPLIQDEDRFHDKLNMALPISHKYCEKYKLYGKKIVLYIGRLAKEKNLDALLNSICNISKNRNDTYAIFVGEGSHRMKLEQKVWKHDLQKYVLFPGRFDGLELIAWYNIGQLFVLPSIHEPYGAVVNEALISGIPVITSNVAGASDLVNSLEQGSIFNSEYPKQLDSLIEEYIVRLEPLKKPLFVRKNRMKYKFREEMNNLAYFLNNIQKI